EQAALLWLVRAKLARGAGEVGQDGLWRPWVEPHPGGIDQRDEAGLATQHRVDAGEQPGIVASGRRGRRRGGQREAPRARPRPVQLPLVLRLVTAATGRCDLCVRLTGQRVEDAGGQREGG